MAYFSSHIMCCIEWNWPRPFLTIYEMAQFRYHNTISKCFLKIPGKPHHSDFICLTSSNFVTTSHINYWNQVNSWKNLRKFWNGTLCRNKSRTCPLLDVSAYWKSSNNEVCTNTDIGGRGVGLRIYVTYKTEMNNWFYVFQHFN